MAVKAAKRVPAMLLGAAAIGALCLCLIELGVDQIVGIDGHQWHWIGLVLGGVLGWLGWERATGIVALIGFAVLLTVQWWAWPATQARRFIRSDPLPQQPVDAIVVLSASITDEGRISQVAVDRLLEGIRLYQAGVSKRIVVSRIETDRDGKPVTTDKDQRALIALAGGSPEVHVLWPVGTTRTEALRMEELALREGWKSIVLVTSPTHTKRACAAFEAVGLTVTCRASPDRDVAWSQLDSPSDRARAVGQLAYETLGWWEYRARGWIEPSKR